MNKRRRLGFSLNIGTMTNCEAEGTDQFQVFLSLHAVIAPT